MFIRNACKCRLFRMTKFKLFIAFIKPVWVSAVHFLFLLKKIWKILNLLLLIKYGTLINDTCHVINWYILSSSTSNVSEICCQYAMHIIANIHCILLLICNMHCIVLSICIVYYCQYALHIIVNMHCILLPICIEYYCQYMHCILLPI